MLHVFAQEHLTSEKASWTACLLFCICLLFAPGAAQAEEPLLIKGSPLLSNAPAQDNGIPALRLSIDPDEYQKMIDAPNHEYRATGATISLDVPDGYTGEFGETELGDLEDLSLEYIRGRGNSTWYDDKKPFKFKLDAKANLLGMGGGRHWVLLANAYDDSLLRNRIAYYMGRELGLEFTPKMAPVDLYVNNEFLGSYTLCPEVRIDGSSVDIDELGSDDVDLPEISGGYLVALKPYEDEDDANLFTTTRGVEFFLNEPNFNEEDDLNAAALQAQRAFITASKRAAC